jgi:hypothetical protein
MLCLDAIDRNEIGLVLARFGMRLRLVPADVAIPGSYWGDSEAGLKGDELFARLDTPVHSLLHEACHYVCMTADRRAGLDRDAGGDFLEECGVCYLQLVLADELRGVGLARLCSDMDEWGYTFRLGSTREWLEHDADDARAWLLAEGLIDAAGRPTWRVRP